MTCELPSSFPSLLFNIMKIKKIHFIKRMWQLGWCMWSSMTGPRDCLWTVFSMRYSDDSRWCWIRTFIIYLLNIISSTMGMLSFFVLNISFKSLKDHNRFKQEGCLGPSGHVLSTCSLCLLLQTLQMNQHVLFQR